MRDADMLNNDPDTIFATAIVSSLQAPDITQENVLELRRQFRIVRFFCSRPGKFIKQTKIGRALHRRLLCY